MSRSSLAQSDNGVEQRWKEHLFFIHDQLLCQREEDPPEYAIVTFLAPVEVEVRTQVRARAGRASGVRRWCGGGRGGRLAASWARAQGANPRLATAPLGSTPRWRATTLASPALAARRSRARLFAAVRVGWRGLLGLAGWASWLPRRCAGPCAVGCVLTQPCCPACSPLHAPGAHSPAHPPHHTNPRAGTTPPTPS